MNLFCLIIRIHMKRCYIHLQNLVWTKLLEIIIKTRQKEQTLLWENIRDFLKNIKRKQKNLNKHMNKFRKMKFKNMRILLKIFKNTLIIFKPKLQKKKMPTPMKMENMKLRKKIVRFKKSTKNY